MIRTPDETPSRAYLDATLAPATPRVTPPPTIGSRSQERAATAVVRATNERVQAASTDSHSARSQTRTNDENAAAENESAYATLTTTQLHRKFWRGWRWHTAVFVLAGVLVIWGRLALFQPQADGALPVVTSTAGVLWNWTVSCGLLAMLMTVAVAVSFSLVRSSRALVEEILTRRERIRQTDGRTAAATSQAQVPVRKRLRFLKEFAQTETLATAVNVLFRELSPPGSQSWCVWLEPHAGRFKIRWQRGLSAESRKAFEWTEPDGPPTESYSRLADRALQDSPTFDRLKRLDRNWLKTLHVFRVIHNHETRGILVTTALLPDVPLPSDHKERNANGISDAHEFALEDTIDRLTSLWQQDHQQQLAELPQLPTVAPTLAILPTSDEGNGIGSDGSSAGQTEAWRLPVLRELLTHVRNSLAADCVTLDLPTEHEHTSASTLKDALPLRDDRLRQANVKRHWLAHEQRLLSAAAQELRTLPVAARMVHWDQHNLRSVGINSLIGEAIVLPVVMGTNAETPVAYVCITWATPRVVSDAERRQLTGFGQCLADVLSAPAPPGINATPGVFPTANAPRRTENRQHNDIAEWMHEFLTEPVFPPTYDRPQKSHPSSDDDNGLAHFDAPSESATPTPTDRQPRRPQGNDGTATATATSPDRLAIVSHELRGPMNGLMGMLQLVLRTELSPEQREYLGVVESSSQSLLGMLDDVLDDAKLQSGEAELHVTRFPLATLIHDVLRTFAAAAGGKDVDLIAALPSTLPAEVATDRGRLRQVLANLAGNAVKFTAQGEVELSARLVSNTKTAEQSGSGSALKLQVRDTGVGIPADRLDDIFLPYRQAATDTTEKFGGTGLGLSIARELVQLLGGELRVTSEVGVGTTFHFEIPVDVPADEQQPLSSTQPLAGQCVQLDIRNAALANSLREPLEQAGASVVQVAAEVEVDQTTNTILLTDRPDTTNRHAGVAGIVHLLHPGEQPAAAAGDSSVEQRLIKPVLPADVITAVHAVLLESVQAPTVAVPATTRVAKPQPQSPDAATKTLRVLIVDDDPVSRLLLVRAISRCGHQSLECVDGLDADDALALVASSDSPLDLVMMDGRLPGLAAEEVVRKQREREAATGRRLPIVVASGLPAGPLRQPLQQAGIDGWMTKPVQISELEVLLQRIATMSANEDASSATQPVSNDVQTAPDNEIDSLEADFFARCDQLLPELALAIADGNATLVAETAHALKSTAAVLEQIDLEDQLLEIELRGVRNQLAGSASLLDAVHDHVNQLRLTGLNLPPDF